MPSFRSALQLLLAASLAACAPGAAGSGAARNTALGPIDAAEALASGATNAYEVVQARRPNWLRVRGAHTLGNANEEIAVYLDTARLGGPESLRQVATANVGEIRFYGMSAANFRFGPGHLNGAIQVVTGAATRTTRP